MSKSVLSKRPGYGGWFECEVVGEDDKYYALEYHGRLYNSDIATAVFMDNLNFPPDFTKRNSHSTIESFRRKKAKCILLSAPQSRG